jgi:hypothetical protein
MNSRAAILAFAGMIEGHISSVARCVCLLWASEQTRSNDLRSALTDADAGRHE